MHSSSVIPARNDQGSHEEQVTAQAINYLYQNLSTVVIGTLLVPIVMIVVLWKVIDPRILLVWFIAVLVVAAVRLLLARRFMQRKSVDNAARWGNYFTLTSLANGLLWGSAGLLFFVPDSTALQIFLFTTLTGLATGSLIAALYWPASFYVFAVPILGLCALRLALEGSAGYLGLAVMMFMHIGILIPIARNMHRAGITAIRLSFENLDLVQGLSVQRDAAERANIAKSKFLAAASHDLRQPLHSLTLFTSVLDERITYPDVRKVVGNINASVRALEQLFNALLDISRLDAGVLQPTFRHFRLQDIHLNVANDFAPEAQSKGLKFICPPCTFIVYSDPVLLERILRNFISNAIRYTEQGGIRVECIPQGDSLRIDVLDTGIGIPASQQREIFNEFFQLGNPERDRTKGLGLGLAIVDRVAKLLGHAIEVESVPGQGSRFSVRVPLRDAGQVAVEDHLPTDSMLNDLNGLRVLVVDDEISIREGMQVLLEQWGCSVMLAGSEEEAVAVVRAAGVPPQALIADYRLRADHTGVQVIERLQNELALHIPALIISGDTAPERLREVRASGYQLLHKPVQPAMLRSFLRNVRRMESVSKSKV